VALVAALEPDSFTDLVIRKGLLSWKNILANMFDIRKHLNCSDWISIRISISMVSPSSLPRVAS